MKIIRLPKLSHKSVTAMLLIAVFFVSAGLIWRSSTANVEELLLTDSTNGLMANPDGSVVVVPTKPDQQQQSQATDSNTKDSSKESHQESLDDETKLSQAKEVAPKQARTISKVKSEKRYYLLADPNDSYYSPSWVFGAVNASTAWSQSPGPNAPVVAVLDSGFALNHQDLVNQWYGNSGEQGGGKENDGIDNDGNGYVDDYLGWDFAQVDNIPDAGSVDPNGDGVSHGTQVAGLVGAETDNNVGVASLARGAKIMPLQVMDDYGSGYTSDIASAIYYAVDNGASIINMSLGAAGDDPDVRVAVDYAISNNVVIVAASGNCGNNNSGVCAGQINGFITFPASYEKVIAVGAANEQGQLASFSSFGQRLDLLAPGSGGLYSTTYTSSNQVSAYVANLYGTSFASPITSSAAALIKSVRPDTSVEDIRALLLASASKLSSMNGQIYTSSYGHGMLNAGKSVEVSSWLQQNPEQVPTLETAEASRPEHDYSTRNLTTYGCRLSSPGWCTVLINNAQKNQARYMPYSYVSQSGGLVDWTWSGSLLGVGQWTIQAEQGQILSGISNFEITN